MVQDGFVRPIAKNILSASHIYYRALRFIMFSVCLFFFNICSDKCGDLSCFPDISPSLGEENMHEHRITVIMF